MGTKELVDIENIHYYVFHQQLQFYFIYSRSHRSNIVIVKSTAPNTMFTHIEIKVLVTQLCNTFCNLIDCIHDRPGSSVHGILWERILE